MSTFDRSNPEHRFAYRQALLSVFDKALETGNHPGLNVFEELTREEDILPQVNEILTLRGFAPIQDRE